MVAGLIVAISLWARGGTNLLIQSHGLGARVVHDATREVAQTLGVFAAGRGRGNLDGSGDNAPAFALGQLKVLRGRYMVTYRLVNAVYVMVVTHPTANAFLCVQLLEAVTKILVATARGVDVTPDKIGRKYQEVYSLLDGLLDGGLAVLPPAFAHRSATADMLLTVPASATDAAHKLKKMFLAGKAGVAGLPKKGGEGGGPHDPTPPPVPETPAQAEGRQFAPEEVDPLFKVAFEVPPDALPPPPSRAAVVRRPPPPTTLPAQAAAAVAFAGAVKTQQELEEERAAAEAAAAAAAAEALRAAGLTGGPAKASEDGEWAQFAEEPEPAPTPPPVQQPVISEKDVRDSLQLLEVWRAEVAGGKLLRAGTEGSVRFKLAPYGLNRARFRLRPARSSLVNACLRVALLNAQFAEKQAGGPDGEAFAAAIARAPVGCCYLKYRLPAVACAPPLQLSLHFVQGSDAAPRGGAQPQLLVVLRYVANPKMPGSLLDAVVDLDLPPQVGGLVKVTPAAQWCKDRCQLRWEVGRILPRQEGLLRAVVSLKQGINLAAGLAAVQQQAVARVLFTGQRGRSLSGLGFEAGMEEEGAAFMPGAAQYFAEVTVKA